MLRHENAATAAALRQERRVPQLPAAPPAIGPPPVPSNTGAAPMPRKPPSPLSIPPLPPGPALSPANVTFWPVNMYISVAAFRPR